MRSSAKLVRNPGKEKTPKKVHAKSPHRSRVSNDQSQFLRLERAIGNRAMGQLIQATLTIGSPNDKYEQEADRVADMVMRMPQPNLQRVCHCGGGCPRCQEEQQVQKHPLLQNRRGRANGVGQTVAPRKVHEALCAPGQPLDSATRKSMESRFEHDFSRVLVHTDGKAVESARKLNALAYTVGRDIVFGAGQYRPGTTIGRRLLAHELTHVLQQGNEKSVIRRKIQFVPPTSIRENPIPKVLLGTRNIGLTRPTFNNKPLPVVVSGELTEQQMKTNFLNAGNLIFNELKRKGAHFDPSTQECTPNDFDVKVSAVVTIPTEPKENKWTKYVEGSDIKNISICRKKVNVPVVMMGKPDSKSLVENTRKIECEHVKDLKKLYCKHLRPYVNNLLSRKIHGPIETCARDLFKDDDDKREETVFNFLNDLREAVEARDARGKHKLKNLIRVKPNCSRVEITSTWK